MLQDASILVAHERVPVPKKLATSVLRECPGYAYACKYMLVLLGSAVGNIFCGKTALQAKGGEKRCGE